MVTGDDRRLLAAAAGDKFVHQGPHLPNSERKKVGVRCRAVSVRGTRARAELTSETTSTQRASKSGRSSSSFMASSGSDPSPFAHRNDSRPGERAFGFVDEFTCTASTSSIAPSLANTSSTSSLASAADGLAWTRQALPCATKAPCTTCGPRTGGTGDVISSPHSTMWSACAGVPTEVGS